LDQVEQTRDQLQFLTQLLHYFQSVLVKQFVHEAGEGVALLLDFIAFDVLDQFKILPDLLGHKADRSFDFGGDGTPVLLLKLERVVGQRGFLLVGLVLGYLRQFVYVVCGGIIEFQKGWSA